MVVMRWYLLPQHALGLWGRAKHTLSGRLYAMGENRELQALTTRLFVRSYIQGDYTVACSAPIAPSFERHGRTNDLRSIYVVDQIHMLQ
jgi:hypothetical protein